MRNIKDIISYLQEKSSDNLKGKIFTQLLNYHLPSIAKSDLNFSEKSNH